MKKNIIYSILLMICANLAVAVDFKEGATTGKVVKNVEESPDKKILNWGNLQKNSAKNFLNENPDVRNAKKLTLACSDKYLGVLIFEKIIVHLE